MDEWFETLITLSLLNNYFFKEGCSVLNNDLTGNLSLLFIINPENSLHNTKIKTFGDHRIAMAFTIAGLLTPERNILDDENCINISFPEFNTLLHQVLI